MKRRLFTRPITVVLSEELHQQLEEFTHQNEQSLSEWVRDAIHLKLNQNNQKSEE
jgi:metal-responsive CopG/Arc/MetJ family transcriptional regulator